jgi:amino acid transporter
MKVTGALLLTLSAVTPASSVFVIVPGIIQQAGTGAFISMGAAAFVALAMAFVYAELGSAFPMAGGEYSLMGHTLGPFVGFVYMGMNTVGSTLAPAVLSLGASTYAAALWSGIPSVPLAVGIVFASMLLGILNIRLNAWVTGAFLVVELLALIVLTSLGLAHVRRSPLGFLTHPMVVTHGHMAPAPIAAIGLATAVAVFSYNGFGSTVYFSEEMHDAPRRVARTILIALGLTVAFEFIPMTAVLLGAPDLAAMMASASPFSDFVQAAGGSTLNRVVSLGIALAIVNAVIAIVLINARFFYSSGRDRVWHLSMNAWLVRVHGRFDSPWVATFVAGATGIAACFIPFHFLLVLNGAGVVVMYFFLCLGALAGRITGATRHAAYRMPLFPLAPVFGLLVLLYVLYANWIDQDVGRPSLIANLVMMAGAGLYYVVLRRQRGAAWAPERPRLEAQAD